MDTAGGGRFLTARRTHAPLMSVRRQVAADGQAGRATRSRKRSQAVALRTPARGRAALRRGRTGGAPLAERVECAGSPALWRIQMSDTRCRVQRVDAAVRPLRSCGGYPSAVEPDDAPGGIALIAIRL